MISDPVAWLSQDPDLAALIGRVGPCRLRGDDGLEPYTALLRAIAGQQLHGAAARRIYARLCLLGGTGQEDGPPPGPAALLALPEDALRQCGLSRSKLEAMRGVASATLEGRIPDRAQAALLDDDTLIARLTALRGIGRWTADMVLIFTLRRQDVMPAEDYGIREGWRLIKGRAERPSPKILRRETERFSPWRSALSWYCWEAVQEARRRA